MFHNFLILALRTLLKNKVNSIISVLGLTIGLSVFILVGIYLRFEHSWDKNNENYSRIYRLQQLVDFPNGEQQWTYTPAALAKYIRENYPEAENTVLLREEGEFLSTSEVRTFYDPDGYYAEPSVFSVFTYEFLTGDKIKALNEPFSIVLSEKLAQKLFPEQNPIGKDVILGKKYTLKVTGIFKDLPLNTLVRPSFIIPFAAFETTHQWKDVQNNWKSSSFMNYVLLNKYASKESFENKIVNLFEKFDEKKKLYLLPLKDQFLRPQAKNDYLVALFLYGLIALLILLLACVNFINLTTANSSTRAREIGIKKVNGSSRFALFRQFVGESIIITLIAVNFAFMVAKLFLPVFCRIINRQLEFSWHTHNGFILFIFGIALAVGFLSGIYPALVLSSFKTVNVLKADSFKNVKGRIGLKKVLVTFQFFISVFLVIATLIVFRQINFMMHKDLGFNINNIIYTRIMSDRKFGNISEIRSRLLQVSEVEKVTISRNIPFSGREGKNINWEGSGEEKINIRFNKVDNNFLETFQIKLLMGRNFLQPFADSSNECLINETAMKLFGWDDPIGKHIYDNAYQIVGVIRDFHQSSVHDLIEPCFFTLHNGNSKGNNAYSIRVNTNDLNTARQKVTEVFASYFPDDAFELWTLKDKLYDNTAYMIWDGVNKTFRFYTALAIFISIMGLFGLISFTAKKRTKEMGVRKVHGSTPSQIYFILAKEFVPLIAIAIVLGSIAACTLYTYLPGAYKYQLQVKDFVYAWLLTIVIALLTISFQAMKVAYSNPVESLRYE